MAVCQPEWMLDGLASSRASFAPTRVCGEHGLYLDKVTVGAELAPGGVPTMAVCQPEWMLDGWHHREQALLLQGLVVSMGCIETKLL